MFLSRNKKNNVYPCKPQFYYTKVGFKGSNLYGYVFVMYALRIPLNWCKNIELELLSFQEVRRKYCEHTYCRCGLPTKESTPPKPCDVEICRPILDDKTSFPYIC